MRDQTFSLAYLCKSKQQTVISFFLTYTSKEAAMTASALLSTLLCTKMYGSQENPGSRLIERLTRRISIEYHA